MTRAIAYPFLKRRNNPYKLVQLYTRDIAKGPCSLNKKYKPPVEKRTLTESDFILNTRLLLFSFLFI